MNRTVYFSNYEKDGYAKFIRYQPKNENLSKACGLYSPESGYMVRRDASSQAVVDTLLKFYYMELFLETNTEYEKLLGEFVEDQKGLREFLARSKNTIDDLLLELDKRFLHKANAEKKLTVPSEPSTALVPVDTQSYTIVSRATNQRSVVQALLNNPYDNEKRMQLITLVLGMLRSLEIMHWNADSGSVIDVIALLGLIAEIKKILKVIDQSDPLYLLLYRGVLEGEGCERRLRLYVQTRYHEFTDYVAQLKDITYLGEWRYVNDHVVRSNLYLDTKHCADSLEKTKKENNRFNIDYMIPRFRDCRVFVEECSIYFEIGLLFPEYAKFLERLKNILAIKTESSDDSTDAEPSPNAPQALAVTTTSIFPFKVQNEMVTRLLSLKSKGHQDLAEETRRLSRRLHKHLIRYFREFAILYNEADPSIPPGYRHRDKIPPLTERIYHPEDDNKIKVQVAEMEKIVEQYSEFESMIPTSLQSTNNEEDVNVKIARSLQFLAFEEKDIHKLTQKQLHQRYRALALKYHPDRGDKSGLFTQLALNVDCVKTWIAAGRPELKSIIAIFSKKDNKRYAGLSRDDELPSPTEEHCHPSVISQTSVVDMQASVVDMQASWAIKDVLELISDHRVGNPANKKIIVPQVREKINDILDPIAYQFLSPAERLDGDKFCFRYKIILLEQVYAELSKDKNNYFCRENNRYALSFLFTPREDSVSGTEQKHVKILKELYLEALQALAQTDNLSSSDIEFINACKESKLLSAHRSYYQFFCKGTTRSSQLASSIAENVNKTVLIV